MSISLLCVLISNCSLLSLYLCGDLKIVTICDADNLSNCMPYTKLKLKDGTEKNLSDFKTAESLGVYSDDTNDYSSPNVGIVLADGTPMILNYNLKDLLM